MADIFNFAQKGLGKLVGFGKKGPRLEAEHQDGNFRVATYNGYTEVQVHGANATVADSLITKAQLDYTYGEGVLNIVTTEVSYTDGNVALFEAPANSMIYSITVDIPSSWVNATNSTSISIGDGSGSANSNPDIGANVSLSDWTNSSAATGNISYYGSYGITEPTTGKFVVGHANIAADYFGNANVYGTMFDVSAGDIYDISVDIDEVGNASTHTGQVDPILQIVQLSVHPQNGLTPTSISYPNTGSYSTNTTIASGASKLALVMRVGPHGTTEFSNLSVQKRSSSSASTDNLFGASEADLTQSDKFSSEYRKIYEEASNVTAYVNADGATSGTATITCTVLLEAAASKTYVSMGGGITGIGGIGTYVAPDPVISGTSNNTIVSSSNGTAITSSGSSYVELQNLPSYLDGNPMVTDINNGTVSWNIPATTVYMVRNDEWNAVSTTGWTLKDGSANILTNQTSGNVEVYQKDFTPGIYNFDDDSAIYFFDYSTTYAPTTQEIDETTEINIFFDSSGSMDSTLSPLETMRDGVLRTALEPFYDNDSAAYNAAVTITSISTERVFDQLATMGSANATRVINLVFADENSPYAAVGSYPATPNGTLSGDISALRSAVSTSNSAEGTDYYRSILFQINTGPNSFSGFKQMTQAVYNGTGSYSGTAGLSDFNEAQTFLINDVQAAGNATFYANQIIAGLNSLGYDLDELSY